jgi:hypothetical protein
VNESWASREERGEPALEDVLLAGPDRRIAELETRLAFAIGMLDELMDYSRSGWSGPYSEDWKRRVARLKEEAS